MKKDQKPEYALNFRNYDWRYEVLMKVPQLVSYPIKDGSDTFRYTMYNWIVIEVLVGESNALKRLKELIS